MRSGRRAGGLALAVVALGSVALSRPATAQPTKHLEPAHQFVLPAHKRAAAASALAAPATDVTGDGRADAVVRDPGPDAGALRVYPNNGSTTSNPWTGAFSLAGSQWAFANALLVADVTGDGRPDLVARDPSVGNGTLWVYPNNGATTGNPWTSRFSAGTGWNTVNALLLDDVTGDGQPDLVARDPSVDNGTLWVYPSNGSTTSNPWTRPRIWSGTGWNIATALMIGDVTGDGHPEMLLRDSTGALWIYPHNGATNSNPWTSRVPAGGGWNLADVLLLGDVTGDGHRDIVVRDSTGGLWIYPNSGATTGNPWTVPRYSAGSGWDAVDSMMLADLAGNGHPSLVGRALAAGDLWVYPNNGSTTASPWTRRFPAGSNWAFEDALLLGDVTGDGHPDVVVRDPAVDNGTLWVYPGDGSTTSNPWTRPRVAAGTGWNTVHTLMLGDVTGDGHPDMVVRDSVGNLWVYAHTGATSGNPWGTRTWAGSGWNTATNLTLGDVNHDGVADLIDQELDGTLWIYLSGSSAAPIQVAGDWTSTNLLVAGDVNGDGRADLVTRDTSGVLSIHPNNGSTAGNPWTTRVPGGADWGFASALAI